MKTKLLRLMLVLAAFICVVSCSDGDDEQTLDKSSITLYVDESSILIYSGGKCTWSSDNFLVAEVENGIVTAKHVGKTIIHANDLVCEVIVKPRYTSYTEPYQVWGASKSQVKSFMSGYTLKGEESTTLVYLGKGKVNAYVYQFENAVLKNSAFQVTLLNSANLTDFLLERYWVIDVEDKGNNNFYAYMCSVDLKTYIMFNLTSNGSIVAYIPAESIKSSKKADIKSQLREIEALNIGACHLAFP